MPKVGCRAVNPPRHQILRIDREGMIDDVISHEKGRHLCQKLWRAVCFKINFFMGYKFLISFADRIYRPVIDQLKYYYIVLIFYQIHVKSISCSMIDQLCVFSFGCD